VLRKSMLNEETTNSVESMNAFEK